MGLRINNLSDVTELIDNTGSQPNLEVAKFMEGVSLELENRGISSGDAENLSRNAFRALRGITNKLEERARKAHNEDRDLLISEGEDPDKVIFTSEKTDKEITKIIEKEKKLMEKAAPLAFIMDPFQVLRIPTRQAGGSSSFDNVVDPVGEVADFVEELSAFSRLKQLSSKREGKEPKSTGKDNPLEGFF